MCLVAAVTVLAACSSTTAVSSDDQATPSAGAADIDAAGDNASDSPQELSEDDRDSATADTGAADAAAEDDDHTVTGGETDATEGFGLGGAEQIESLVDDCQDDNDLACDILFQISAFNSDEERTAVTCGGRSDAEVSFCTAGIDAGADEFLFDPDSDGLDRGGRGLRGRRQHDSLRLPVLPISDRQRVSRDRRHLRRPCERGRS